MIPANEAYVIRLDAIVKAHPPGADGKRVVEVEASSEQIDSEGDIVMQKALLDSASAFCRSGHLDIDHISEVGRRYGVKNPESYIVGRPLEVKDIGGGRTSVVGEIMRSIDGSVSPDTCKYDAFWGSLQSEPPVHWYASIFGYPTEWDDCTEKACSADAKRYVIKQIDWRSLAFTRNPVNTALRGTAKIMTAKAFVAGMASEVRKDFASPFGLSADMPMGPPFTGTPGTPEAASNMPMPFSCGSQCPVSMDALWGNYIRSRDKCEHLQFGASTVALTEHYMLCCGAPKEFAELLAYALMYMIMRDRVVRK